MKNLTELLGNRKEIKSELKLATLSNNDALLVAETQDEMICRLQAKLRQTKEKMHRLIAEL